ncbi:MAG: filamentous hemagglutinin N-terminal domain-containing protein [Leptolyngbyaceae cyanobacterium SL_7_1]|nr:filamentous hemagglutinin N-terminal domain-containing protein [Leptolyngbyaceae cyanobacterium SL_7_1]
MARYWRSPSLVYSLLSSAIALLPSIALAEPPRPDGTTPTVVEACPGDCDRITGGELRDTNLFHSFEAFDVDLGRRVEFDSQSGGIAVTNIFSRVTTNNPSEIRGELAVNGTANLFLLNPYGILFGAEARLDIRGSFLATTANAIEFDGGSFIAVQTEIPPLLNIPRSVRFTEQISRQQAIGLTEAQLTVPAGRRILLLGASPDGNGITIDGGRLRAPGGRIELGAIATPRTIPLTITDTQVQLAGFARSGRSNIALLNGAQLDVRTDLPRRGGITVYADDLSIDRLSGLLAGRLRDSNVTGIAGGVMQVDATGAVRLRDRSYLINLSSARSAVEQDDITIRANSLVIRSGSQIDNSVSGGNAGRILITTPRGNVVLDGVGFATGDSLENELITPSTEGDLTRPRFISAIVNRLVEGEGRAGDIVIEAAQVLIRGGATVVASNQGEGEGGDIRITASGRVSLVGEDEFGRSSALASRLERATGRGGTIRIEASDLFITEGGLVTVSSLGRGQAGDIVINVQNQIFAEGVGSDRERTPAGLNSRVLARGVGQGGEIIIESARLVHLTNGSEFRAGIVGDRGAAGSIRINSEVVRVDGEAAISATTESAGRGGEIEINSDRLIVQNGSTITARTDSQGAAGSLTITTDELVVSGGSTISADTEGLGRAGRLDIEASGTVTVQGGVVDDLGNWQPSSLNFNTTNAGNAGRLAIQAARLIVQDGAAVSARTTAAGMVGSSSSRLRS